jgi:hypothetical protein
LLSLKHQNEGIHIDPSIIQGQSFEKLAESEGAVLLSVLLVSLKGSLPKTY